MNKRKIIIYDPEILGHHVEYIEHIAIYLSEGSQNIDCYFVVNPRFLEKFRYIIDNTKINTSIHWLYLTKEELKRVSCKNLIIRSFINYFLVRKYMKKVDADKVLIMHINNFQLAFSFFSPKFKVSGILFLQFYRQSRKTLKEKIKYLRKYLTTKLFARNKSIENVYVLNDSKSVEFMNSEFRTSIFKMLPDPIPELKVLENLDVYAEYGINRERRIFLHIGALEDRKGTLEILDAITYLEGVEQNKTCIIIAGKSNESFKKRLEEKIEFYQKKSKVQIIWIDDFISKELMKTLFEQCYCVLLPYKNPESSSGIFGHAAVAEKVIIGSSQGLLGEMINAYKLGITIDAIDSQCIANAMIKTPHCKEENSIEFDHDKSPRFFAESLIADL